jgi:hypothetical protein
VLLHLIFLHFTGLLEFKVKFLHLVFCISRMSGGNNPLNAMVHGIEGLEVGHAFFFAKGYDTFWG